MPVRKQGGECDQFVECNNVQNITDFAPRPARKHAEAHRALELLEDYHAKLTRPQDKQLRLAIERVIRIFKSRLFQALLGMGICGEKVEREHDARIERIDPTPLKNYQGVIIFMIGGPGAGKSTISQKLAPRYGLFLVSVSQMLHEEVASGSERGELFRRYMARGSILPAEIIVQLVVHRMLAHLQTHGFLVVGFPRDKKQAVMFNTEVRQPDLVLNLYARRVILQERLALRASIARKFDDTAEAVINRMIQYYTNVKGAIGPNKGVTKLVDAEAEMSDVFIEACTLVDLAMAKPRAR